MRARLALVPLTLLAAGAGVGVLHPGVAQAAPRLAGAPSVPFAQAASYALDPAHAGISFEIVHMGLAHVHGRLNRFRGTVVADAKDLSKCSVQFTGEVASLDTAVPPRDKHLQAADYFDAAAHPEITFRSTKIEKTRKGYTATGDLTIKGRTKSVAIPFRHVGPVASQGAARIGIIAEPFTIRRSDFGVGGTDKLPNGTMPLSDEVTMRISFEAVQTKS